MNIVGYLITTGERWAEKSPYSFRIVTTKESAQLGHENIVQFTRWIGESGKIRIATVKRCHRPL